MAGIFAAEEDLLNYQKISSQIAKDVETYRIPGMAVMVVSQDEILFQETYGNCESVDTPFIIGSMSKSFTALAIMQLVEAGKIDLDQSLSQYMDASEWFQHPGDLDKISVRDLLNQTSGISTYQTFGSLKQTDSDGSYIYANANYGLLGLMIEAVSGMSYEEYVTTNIFRPLGMVHSSTSLETSKEKGLIDGYRNYFGIPVSGEPDYPAEIGKGTWTSVSAGYLSSSVSDMGKYLQMYLKGGAGLMSPNSINSMFYDTVSADDKSFEYGMGWMYSTRTFSQPVLWHVELVENYTSSMYILPEKKIGVIVLVNMNDYLVTNNLLGNIVNPLLGEEKQNLPNLYLILHIVINGICLLLTSISVYFLLTIRRWKKKSKTAKQHLIDCLRHIILPVGLLSLPWLLGTPAWVIQLFVKDLFWIIYLNAGILLIVGVYKLCFLLREAVRKKQAHQEKLS